MSTQEQLLGQILASLQTMNVKLDNVVRPTTPPTTPPAASPASATERAASRAAIYGSPETTAAQTGQLRAAGEVAKQGAQEFTNAGVQMVADTAGVIQAGYDLNMTLARDRYDELLEIQREYGANARLGYNEDLRNFQGALTEGNRVSGLLLDARKAFYSDEIDASGVFTAQMFESEADFLAVQKRLSTGAITGRGIVRDMSNEQIEEAAKLGRAMGFNADQTAEFLDQATARYGTASTRMLRDVAVAAEDGERRTGQSSKKIAQGIFELTRDFDYFGRVSPQALSRTITTMRELGVATDDVSSMVKKFSNFEDAAESVGQLTQLLGMNLDATQLMTDFATDPAKAMMSLRDSFLATGRSIEELDPFTLRQFASSIGISSAGGTEALSQFMRTGEKLDEVLAAAGRTGEGVKPDATAQEAFQALASDIDIVSVKGQDLVNMTKDRLAGALTVDMVEGAAVAGTAMDKLATAIPIRGAQAISDAGAAIQDLTGIDLSNLSTQLENIGPHLERFSTQVESLDTSQAQQQLLSYGKAIGSGISQGLDPVATKFDEVLTRMAETFNRSPAASDSPSEFGLELAEGLIGDDVQNMITGGFESTMGDVGQIGNDVSATVASQALSAAESVSSSSGDLISALETDATSAMGTMSSLNSSLGNAELPKWSEMSVVERELLAAEFNRIPGDLETAMQSAYESIDNMTPADIAKTLIGEEGELVSSVGSATSGAIEAIQNSVNDTEAMKAVIAQPLTAPNQTEASTIVIDTSSAMVNAVNKLSEVASAQTQNEVKLSVDDTPLKMEIDLGPLGIQKLVAALTVDNAGQIKLVTKEA